MTDAPAPRFQPATEQEFLEDNIATVAHHLRQDGARLEIDHRESGKVGLIVEPGEVLREIARRLSVAQPPLMQIAAPGNDQLSKLWNAIVENTKGDGFWIGEILLAVLEREVGFNPSAVSSTHLLPPDQAKP